MASIPAVRRVNDENTPAPSAATTSKAIMIYATLGIIRLSQKVETEYPQQEVYNLTYDLVTFPSDTLYNLLVQPLVYNFGKEYIVYY